MRTILPALLLVLASSPIAAARGTAHPKTLKVTSTAFTNNGDIPAEYTCDGAGSAPPLTWSKAPKGTASIAVLVEDPDAPKGTFVHWMITGLPATQTSLADATALPEGATAMKNGKGDAGWTAPCPPSGRHHYIFQVYALDDTPTSTDASLSRKDFLSTIDGHVIAQGKLIGRYAKTKTR
jgi:Raf kinase inhibitor-like YbhB/YbcL family protein